MCTYYIMIKRTSRTVNNKKVWKWPLYLGCLIPSIRNMAFEKWLQFYCLRQVSWCIASFSPDIPFGFGWDTSYWKSWALQTTEKEVLAGCQMWMWIFQRVEHSLGTPGSCRSTYSKVGEEELVRFHLLGFKPPSWIQNIGLASCQHALLGYHMKGLPPTTEWKSRERI